MAKKSNTKKTTVDTSASVLDGYMDALNAMTLESETVLGSSDTVNDTVGDKVDDTFEEDVLIASHDVLTQITLDDEEETAVSPVTDEVAMPFTDDTANLETDDEAIEIEVPPVKEIVKKEVLPKDEKKPIQKNNFQTAEKPKVTKKESVKETKVAEQPKTVREPEDKEQPKKKRLTTKEAFGFEWMGMQYDF